MMESDFSHVGYLLKKYTITNLQLNIISSVTNKSILQVKKYSRIKDAFVFIVYWFFSHASFLNTNK